MFANRRCLNTAAWILLQVVFFDVVGIATGRGAHSVSQAYTFKVVGEGKVRVLLKISFVVAAGDRLSGSYKSILDRIDVKSVDENSVKCQDELGRDVPITLREKDGWLQAVMVFPEEAQGDGSSKYSLTLDYTIANGLCNVASAESGHAQDYISFTCRGHIGGLYL